MIPVIIVLLVLVSASYFDLRYREIPDIHWWIIGITGIVFMCIHDGMGFQHWMMIIGTAMILLEIMVDMNRTVFLSVMYYLLMAVLFIYPIATMFDDQIIRQFTVVPVCFILFYVMYLSGILKGGADAKCLITIAMVFQTYPYLVDTLIPVPDFDTELLFAYPVVLLFHAALLSLLALLWIIIRKMRNGDHLDILTVTMLRMPIKKARRSHVWPKEDVINGTVMRVNETDCGAYDRLESAGRKDVLVSVIIPFIVPITVAYIFMLFIGSILFIPFM